MNKYSLVTRNYNPDTREYHERKLILPESNYNIDENQHLFLPKQMDKLIAIDARTSLVTYEKLVEIIKLNNQYSENELIQIKDSFDNYLPVICNNKILFNIICQLLPKNDYNDYDVNEKTQAFDEVKEKLSKFLKKVTQEQLDLYFVGNKTLYENIEKYIELRDKQDKTYKEEVTLDQYKDFDIKRILLNYSNLRYFLVVLEEIEKNVDKDKKNIVNDEQSISNNIVNSDDELYVTEESGQMSFIRKR